MPQEHRDAGPDDKKRKQSRMAAKWQVAAARTIRRIGVESGRQNKDIFSTAFLRCVSPVPIAPSPQPCCPPPADARHPASAVENQQKAELIQEQQAATAASLLMMQRARDKKKSGAYSDGSKEPGAALATLRSVARAQIVSQILSSIL